MKLTQLTFAAIASLMLLSACNTVAGIGKDMEKTGDNVEYKNK